MKKRSLRRLGVFILHFNLILFPTFAAGSGLNETRNVAEQPRSSRNRLSAEKFAKLDGLERHFYTRGSTRAGRFVWFTEYHHGCLPA